MVMLVNRLREEGICGFADNGCSHEQAERNEMLHFTCGALSGAVLPGHRV